MTRINTQLSLPRSLVTFLEKHPDSRVAAHDWVLNSRLAFDELPQPLRSLPQLPSVNSYGRSDFSRVVQLARAARSLGAAHSPVPGSGGGIVSAVLTSDQDHLVFVFHPTACLGELVEIGEAPTVLRGTCDNEMTITSFDQAIVELLDLDLDGAHRPTLTSIVCENSREKLIDCWIESVATGASSCSVRLRTDAVEPVEDSIFEPTYNITLFHDSGQTEIVIVSDSDARLVQLSRDNYDRFRQVFETVPHGIFRVTESGNLLYKNSKFDEILGNLDQFDFDSYLTTDGEPLSGAVPRLLSTNEEAHFDAFVKLENSYRIVRIRTRRIRSTTGETEFVGSLEDVTDDVTRSTQLEIDASTDPMTGAQNRRSVENNLAELLDEQTGKAFAVMLLDLDGFKQVNDSLGHSAGDRVIAELGERLLDACRSSDSVGRLGGDEFVMIVRNVDNYDSAMDFADRLLPLMRAPFEIDDTSIELSGSIGVAIAEPGSTVRKVLQMADHAMYQAKRAGRNQASPYHTPDASNPVSPLALRRDLRQAIATNGLDLAFQPIFQIEDLIEPVAAEALLRWDHPTLGSVQPGVMIPIAEQSGLMGELGDWVIHEAVCAAAEINREREADEGPISINVNVSALQVGRPDFVETVAMALDANNLAPELLTIELTESYLIEQLSDGRKALDAVTEMGVRLAIDDFGTGFSTFEYLITMPVYSVKIDPSFTRRLADPRGHAMLSGLGKACNELGMSIIVEGVETPEQLLAAREAGATHAQGFLLGSPIRSQHKAPERNHDAA